MKKRSGSIFVIVLVSVALVIGLVLSSGAIIRSRMILSNNMTRRIELRNDAFSALAQAIFHINSDTNGVDHLGEDWNIPKGYGLSTVYISDELSRIKFQNTEQDVLRALLNDVSAAQGIASGAEVQSQLLFNWWNNLVSSNKDSILPACEELYNVPAADAVMLSAAMPYLTVCGEGKININTVSEPVFKAMVNVDGSGYTREHVAGLYMRLAKMRKRGDYFEKLDIPEAQRLLSIDGAALTAQELLILQILRGKVCTESGIFRIKAVAEQGNSNYTIECIYKRGSSEIFRWIEW